jgi:dihydroxyacetone kinase-like protein
MVQRDGDASLDAAFVLKWIRELASQIREQRDYLTQLDAAIGDADHGINMDRGLSQAISVLPDAQGRTPGEILQAVGRTIINTVGGAAGPLFGGGLRSAGKRLGDRPTFDAEDLLAAMRAGLESIQALGAASVGDKTIVDAYVPALEAFERELRAGRDLASATARAREAAEEGMRSTIPLQARKGRASYLGPRSVGHQDPGATSTALLFAALERATRTRPAATRERP